jgi:large subunit ribosomal protein L21
MYAIVDIKGFQYKITVGDTLRVPLLNLSKDNLINLDKVVFFKKNERVEIGTPYLNNILVQAVVLEELEKGNKVIIFKKKRRKGYRLKKGHRQCFSKICIKNILENGA